MNEDIVNKIITICNKYTFVKEYNNLKQLLIYEFKNTNITKNELENYVDNLTIEDYISDDSYVFMLNFNTSSIPKIIKDEEYIDDLIKKEVNLKTTVEKNILFKEFTKNKIKNIKNLWISYKLNSEKNEYYPSTLIKELNLKEEEYKNDILNSNSIINDKINYAKSLYNFETYGINDNLDIYINTLGNIKYNSYNNKFKGIDIKDLKEYLNYKLNLSYSSLNNYHKCSFRYYLANILNIDKYEDTFEGYLGSLFHDVLEKCLINNLDIDTEINNYINKSERILDNKEKFFINKIKEDIIFARDIIIKQNEDISLDQNYFEKLININKNQDDMEINFKGFIDKILYKTIDDKTYISIIDYKTGNVSADLKYLPYGFNMQLPIYLYLVKKSNLFVNPEIVGFYLQFILNNNLLRNNNKIEEIKKDNLKLVGYSIDNISSLVLFDKNYENSNIIKGLKVKNDGTFYKTAKVLSNDQIENIINTTEKIIDNDIKNILKGEFNINPKKIGYDKEIGCEFCHFKDICYKKNTDEIILEDIGGQDE